MNMEICDLDQSPTPSPRRRSRLRRVLNGGLAGLALTLAACTTHSAAAEPAETNTDATPDCVEMTPPQALDATVSDVLEKGVGFWARQGTILANKPPLYFEASAGKCSIPGGRKIHGPAYITFFDQVAIQPIAEVPLDDPAEIEFVVAHEQGHAVQARTREIYKADNEEERHTLTVLNELQADCYSGMVLASEYPSDVQLAAVYAHSLGGANHGDGYQREGAFLMGADSGTCSYEALAAEVNLPFPVG